MFARFSMILLSLVCLAACAKERAADVIPVKGFEAERYLGQWYEIARLENRFEKGMINVTAHYSRREDGKIKVVNRGYEPDEEQWREAVGKAVFAQGPDVADLKVSFFGPFYAPYVVFELGEDYEYAFVTNNDKTFLWLLSRTPEISDELRAHFESKIQTMGFDTRTMVYNVQKVKNAENEGQ